MRLLLSLLVLTLSACATPMPPGRAADASTLRFSGQVKAIDNGCFSDGVCSVTVGKVVVVTLVGWSHDIWGTREDGLEVGDAASVYCRSTPEGCTLNGDAGYFVRGKR